ncbi:MAG: FixH family protein [Ginsengibacter sp.]
MNWGYKILVVYVVFVVGIVFLVVKASSQKMDLVTTDYYDKELKYQEKIDAMNRVTGLSADVQYEIIRNKLSIVFPKDFAGKKIEGEVALYCPSDEDKDIRHNFSIKDAPLIVSMNANTKGNYELQLTWQADGKSYYFEKKLLIK